MPHILLPLRSGVATGVKGGQSATPDSEKFARNWEKRGKIRKIEKKEDKSGRKGKNLVFQRFFHFAPPDRKGWLRYCPIHANPNISEIGTKVRENRDISEFRIHYYRQILAKIGTHGKTTLFFVCIFCCGQNRGGSY